MDQMNFSSLVTIATLAASFGLGALAGGGVLAYFIFTKRGNAILSGGLRTTMKAPVFSAVNLTGDVINFDMSFGKTVILKFWSLDCHPCIEEFPSLNDAYANLSDDVALFTIATGSSEQPLKEFVSGRGLKFPILLDPQGEIARRYKVRALPFAYLIDAQGMITDTFVGAGRVSEVFQAASGCVGGICKLPIRKTK